MTTQEIFSLIGSYGFPIVMCFVLLWYINSTIKALTTAFNNLKTVVDQNNAVLNTVVHLLNDN